MSWRPAGCATSWTCSHCNGTVSQASLSARHFMRGVSNSHRQGGRGNVLAKRIIPCLDVKDGQVVKGVQFRDHRIVGDILELAQRYRDEGADELVFYDITASS